VSPRSAELLERAREGVASARTQVDAGHAAAAVSTAYYAMLYAARAAALSERDVSARTHAGTRQLFRDTFVVTGEFDAGLAATAQRAQSRREASDYAAATFDVAEARDLLATAERFVEAVQQLTAA
jgi:uncharacterized protein (UPF0332 family)